MKQRIHLLNRSLSERELGVCVERYFDTSDSLILMGEAVCMLAQPADFLVELAAEKRLLSLKTDCEVWQVTPLQNCESLTDGEWATLCARADQVISW